MCGMAVTAGAQVCRIPIGLHRRPRERYERLTAVWWGLSYPVRLVAFCVAAHYAEVVAGWVGEHHLAMASYAKLAALRPTTVAFGHGGAPIVDDVSAQLEALAPG